MTMLGIVMHILSLYTDHPLHQRMLLHAEHAAARRLPDQPYAWFLNRHSADLGKAVLSEVDNVVAQSLVPAMSLLVEPGRRGLHRRRS